MSEHDDHGHVPGHSHAPASFGRAFAVGIALNVAFAVRGSTLAIDATISNRGDSAMPASLGFHPAFAWPLPYGQPRGDHRITFDADERGDVVELDRAEGAVDVTDVGGVEHRFAGGFGQRGGERLVHGHLVNFVDWGSPRGVGQEASASPSAGRRQFRTGCKATNADRTDVGNYGLHRGPSEARARKAAGRSGGPNRQPSDALCHPGHAKAENAQSHLAAATVAFSGL